jgi:predicted small metal-binding protein
MSVPEITRTTDSKREELSWSTLQLALKYTIHAIRCQHDSFALTYQGQQRIKDCFETLRLAKKITKDPTREAQWLTARLMTQLNRALLSHAIQYGVLDWSIVVQKCLGLALQAACSCRVGDASVSRYYEDNECLVYKDVQLRVTIDAQVPTDAALLDRVSFEAKITMRYTKGRKRDASRNHIVVLSSLDDVEFNVVDPLKLLLAHALRHGAVKDVTSVEAAVQNALSHSRNLIQWQYPDRPILCSLALRKFDYSKGAKTQQLLETLNEAATLSGISRRLVTHDIRRGAAADAVQIRPTRTMELAAQALGHTSSSAARGITAKYAGHNTKSTLSDRLHLDSSDSFGLDPVDVRTSTIQKKRKALPAEIDEYLQRPENAHLKKLKAPRHAATRAINKLKSGSSVAGKNVLSASMDAVQVTTFGDDTASSGLPERDGEAECQQQIAQPTQASENDGSDSGVPYTSNSDDISNIDPALLLLSGITVGPCRGESVASHNTKPVEALLEQMGEEDLIKSTVSKVTTARTEMQVLEGPTSVFLSWLSHINTRVVNDTNPAQHSNLDHLRGGSRDDPTFFTHHCKYEAQGCAFSTTSGPSMSHHELTCTPERRQAEAAKIFNQACDIPKCSYIARADTVKAVHKKLTRHKNEQHNVSPVTCPIGGRPECKESFKNLTALGRHKAKCHSDIVPQVCPVTGCTSKTMWKTVSGLDDHIRKGHKMKGKEVSAMLNAAKAVKEAE